LKPTARTGDDAGATFGGSGARSGRVFNARYCELARAKHNARVAIKGCHSSTKRYTLANLALWFYVRYPDSQVITTAPKIDQVRINMWGEIHAAALFSIGLAVFY
jgi:hypothetical protein